MQNSPSTPSAKKDTPGGDNEDDDKDGDSQMAVTSGGNDDAEDVDQSEATLSSADDDEADAPSDPHCSINFVKNTPYKLLVGDTNKCWATATMTDPSPPVNSHRHSKIHPGDYLLVKGNDIKLNKKGATVFDPEEEIILTSDWDRFEADMTGQDLVDLGDETFLLWWQNIEPPKVPDQKRATIAKSKKKRRLK